jgi:hypothetical protein
MLASGNRNPVSAALAHLSPYFPWNLRRRALSDRRRLEDQIDASITASRAHHPFSQTGKRHVATSRPSQRLKA